MRRVMLVVAALAIPLSAATVGIVGAAGTAGASPPVSCTKVTGSLTGTLNFKGCSTRFGKGSAQGNALASGGTITWNGKHKGSVSFSGSVTSPGRGACPVGSTEYDASDVVTAVTGAGAKIVQIGDVITARVCVTSSGALTLVKHTVVTM
jgi:hypothetical protein